MKRKKEKQHFVPRFYLKHWCDAAGKLWVHPADGAQPYRARRESVAYERGLYSTDDTSLKSFDPEKWLGGIEEVYSRRWPEIFNNLSIPETKLNLARFLALQHLRHPSQRQQIADTNKQMLKLLSRLGPETEQIGLQDAEGRIVKVDLNQYRAFLADHQEGTQAAFQAIMYRSVAELAEILVGRTWGLVESPQPYFVTSDRPVVLLRGESTRRAYGFATPGTEVFFPVSPTLLLVISEAWPSDAACISRKDFEEAVFRSAIPLNSAMILSAGRFIFSATPSIPGVL